MNGDLLSVRNLTVAYRTDEGEVTAVEDASLAVPESAIVGVVGESGCGKTTLARALTRVIPENARIAGGEAWFGGADVMALTESEMNRLRWREIAFIPQSAMNSLDPVYRVESQLIEVLSQRGGLGRSAARARAAELFEMVGIEPRRLRDYPHQFSGGMRQRVAIALALALEPKLVIADEPVTALDVIVQRQILDQLRALQQQLGISVVLITHDISVVAYLCDRVVVMYAGRVVESGSMEAVLTRPYHPYTMGLCNAFPDLLGASGTLMPIAGVPPSLLVPPPGCRFAPRCPFARENCRGGSAPPGREVTAGHLAACLRADEAGELREAASRIETWSEMADIG